MGQKQSVSCANFIAQDAQVPISNLLAKWIQEKAHSSGDDAAVQLHPRGEKVRNIWGKIKNVGAPTRQRSCAQAFLLEWLKQGRP
jgi:hypothetical protein